MLADADAWTDLGGGVLVRTSRAFRMNSVLLLHADHAVLIDPGVLPSDLDALAARVSRAAPRRTTLVFTHDHWDHVLGRAWWPGAQTVGHAGVPAALRRDLATTRREARQLGERLGERWEREFSPFELDVSVEMWKTMRLGPWMLEFHPAPGHCPTAVAVSLPSHGLWIVGDFASDTEIPWLDGPPEIYERTVRRLRALCAKENARTLVPGHGSIAYGADAVLARWDADLAYLASLQEAVQRARADGACLEEACARLSGMPIVGRDDPEVPTGPVHVGNVVHAYQASFPPFFSSP